MLGRLVNLPYMGIHLLISYPSVSVPHLRGARGVIPEAEVVVTTGSPTSFLLVFE